MANAMPVLPLVASISVSPGLMVPRASACAIIESAGRSFTEPAGLLPSSLPRTTLEVSPGKRTSFTSGVRPIVSSIVMYFGMSRLRRQVAPLLGAAQQFVDVAADPRADVEERALVAGGAQAADVRLGEVLVL